MKAGEFHATRALGELAGMPELSREAQLAILEALDAANERLAAELADGRELRDRSRAYRELLPTVARVAPELIPDWLAFIAGYEAEARGESAA